MSMGTEKYIYACLYDGTETGYAFATSPKNDFDQEMQKDAKPIEALRRRFKIAGSDEFSLFAELFTNFTESMLGYLEFLPIVASFAPMFSNRMARQTLAEFLEGNSVSRIDRPKSKVYKLLASKSNELFKLRDGLKTAHTVGFQIPRMLLIGAVSSYEHHLSLTARSIIENNTNLLSSKDKTLSYKDILDGQNLDQLKTMILDKEVDGIFRENADKQIKWFEKSIGVENISQNLKTGVV